MSEDRRDLLQLLRYELNFLEQGGYGRNLRQGDIAPFHDTLSCLNFGDPVRRHTCHECCLYDFVPEHSRTEDIPCHFIPLNVEGQNVAGLLRQGSRRELEGALTAWLKSTIANLEKESNALAQSAD